MSQPSVVADNRRDITTARDQTAELEGLYGARKWTELLARCEKLFLTSPFWLDLTFWSAKAAGQLFGDEAKLAIIGELRALLTRDPTLISAADRDGAPLLCDEARDWVERDVTQNDSSRNGEESASVLLPPEIRQLLDSGQIREAMLVASSWITVSNGRVRFARSVALANAFMKLGAAEQSFLVFRGLHSQLRQMTVKEWEPRLFAACLEGYLSSKKMGTGLGMEDEPLLEELSVLDPTAVLGVLPT
jgi:type VI secretion system ImpA/VasJ family protein